MGKETEEEELWEEGPFHYGWLVPGVPSDSGSQVDQPAHIPGKLEVHSP